jgi:hypothetical protein
VNPTFYHNFYTRSPTAPIWNIINDIEPLLEKNIVTTKMKKMAEWLVFYDDLSHFPIEITTLGLHAPCVLNPVYLSTQSDPHKTGHMLG